MADSMEFGRTTVDLSDLDNVKLLAVVEHDDGAVTSAGNITAYSFADAVVDLGNTQVAGLKDDVTNLYTITDSLTTSIDNVTIDVDDLGLEQDENGIVYPTYQGVRSGNGIYLSNSTGGGGGSGSSNAATLTVTNTTGYLSKTISNTESCTLSITWSSVEEETATGDGTLQIVVSGSTVATRNISQGAISVDVSSYLTSGSNKVKFIVSDAYGNTKTIIYTITVVAISISSTFDDSRIYTSDIEFDYKPIGALEKTIYFVLDGTIIGTATTTNSNRQFNYTITNVEHGAHTFQCYFTCTINGVSVTSNVLEYHLIYAEEGDTQSIVSIRDANTTYSQYTSIALQYQVYNPSSLTSTVQLYVNGVAYGEAFTVDQTVQTWTYRATESGSLTLGIYSNGTLANKVYSITEVSIDVAAETNYLSLFLTSYGRSNSETNPAVWSYNDISCTFTDFNFVNDGWQKDDDNISVLRVTGDARLTIPYKPFLTDFASTGKTIEFEFSTSDVMNYDTTLVNCMSGGRGFQITAQRASFYSEQSSISTQYKEDEHIRVSFVVEKKTSNRLLNIYLNGILSGTVQYASNDDFGQTTPVNITIGSNDCTIDLYCIRVYDSDLTRYQIVENWIADTQNGADMIDRYNENNIYDEYGSIVISKLPTYLPYMVINATELPQYKGNKKTCSGYYVNPSDTSKSFTFTNAQIDVQGTSSQDYYRKNYKIKFRNFTDNEGNTSTTYQMRDDSIPVATFCFKADVASSEGANNVELVRLYNDLCPVQTAPQEENSAVRQGIDGFPIVIFWNDGNTTSFLGKYNFNNDKGTEEVYGFEDGDESWEIRNNISNRVIWKTDDLMADALDEDNNVVPAWTMDFEARFPEDNTDITNLQILSTWLSSTDTTAATDSALESSVTYDGVEYITDSADYRLAKFKNEIETYLNLDDAIFYYIFTEIFLMVDSRAKNAFPTKYGSDTWVWLPYDMDTALGINNEGQLAFDYYLEDTDTLNGSNVYNGQGSVLWNNLRVAFASDIEAMYQDLRNNSLFSYEAVEERFEDHQNCWPEAIFNEDAYTKYIEPYELEGTTAYFKMCQGSKAEQRKWWLYNRFRYIDSKYNTGYAKTNYITFRAYSNGNFEITPYADIYARVNCGSYNAKARAFRNVATSLPLVISGQTTDTESRIYSADQIKYIGDLSGFTPGFIDISMATKLQRLIIGSDNVNTMFNEIGIGNNILLKYIDLRNCPNLTQTIDVRNCTNLEEIYLNGTSVAGLMLPNGGIVTTVNIPDTISYLQIQNQSKITSFTMAGYKNLSTLWLENVPEVIPVADMIEAMTSGGRIRVIGYEFDVESFAEVETFVEALDTMRGLDAYGNTTEHAQISCIINIDTLTADQYDEVYAKYPNIVFNYNYMQVTVSFYDYDGTTLLHTQTENLTGPNQAITYSGTTPTRTSTAQYDYTFDGWSSIVTGDTVDLVVSKNTSFYAHYSHTLRNYTVRFYNGTTLLQTSSVQYGSTPSYTGETPVYNGDEPDNYGEFRGWNPSLGAITGNTDYYARYLFTGSITVSYLESTITTFGDTDFSSYTKLGEYLFWDTSKLADESISFPNVIEVGEQAFSLSKFTTIELPKAVTIGAYAFQNCKVTSLSLPKVTTIGDNAFSGCSYLSSLYLPELTTIDGAFRCGTMTSIELPKLTTMTGNYGFANTSLEHIDAPLLENLPSYCFSSNATAFNTIKSINTTTEGVVYWPSVTNVQNSGVAGSNITIVVMPSLESIFWSGKPFNLPALESLVLPSTETVPNILSGYSFLNHGITSDTKTRFTDGNAFIYVPSSMVESYQASSCWSSASDYIRAIEDYSDIQSLVEELNNQ